MNNIDFIAPNLMTGQIMSIALAFIFIVYAIFSIALLYHWYKFASRSSLIFVAQTIYFSVSLVFFIGALISIVTF